MAKAVKKPRKKQANGYKMPDPLPLNEILTDVGKNSWRLGRSIGKGGFGEIYEAQVASTKSSKYPYVIKVEPHENGPLFVEMHFYMKNAKREDIENFKKKHKLKSFGMPCYIGSGRHEVGSVRYRFIVMERFGTDVDKMRRDHDGALPVSKVFQIGQQLLYVLQYIHELGYVHADIKGGNVLMGVTADTKNQAYLIDFGLGTKFSTDKVFKPNPKKAHDGTLEYLSRDAHSGVPTRRGDLEILAYNLVHWLGGTLPWENKDDPKTVQQMKEEAMSDTTSFLKTAFSSPKTNKTITALKKLLEYINKLQFNEAPKYDTIHKIFESAVDKNDTEELNTSGARKRRSSSPLKDATDATSEELEVKKPARPRKKKQADEEEPPGEVMTAAMKEILLKKEQNDAKKKKSVKNKVKNEKATAETVDFNGYTAEMIEIKMKKMKAERNGTKKETIRDDVGVLRSRRQVPAVSYDERSPQNRRKKLG